MKSPLKIAQLAFAALLALVAPQSADAATDYFRLSWRDNPSTTMVVGWRQNGGSSPVVHYGTTDQGTNYASYPLTATPSPPTPPSTATSLPGRTRTAATKQRIVFLRSWPRRAIGKMRNRCPAPA